MKRFLSFFVALVLTLGVMAQTQHLKFQGIPLNGTISAFHQKLVAKGFKHDAVLSKGLAVGSRAFSGVCFGKKCIVGVYYIPKTKLVYSVGVIIQYDDEDVQYADFEKINEALAKKYPNAEVTEDDEYYETSYVMDEGEITVAIDNDALTILYRDDQNSEKAVENDIEEYIDDL
jgi:hypothetical protein